MAAGVLPNKLPLLIDPNCPRPHHHGVERATKPRPHEASPGARATKHPPPPAPLPSLAVQFNPDASRSKRRRRAMMAKVKSGDGGGSGKGSGDDDDWEWEQKLKMRLKELEDMKELEKKAEELQSQAEDDIEETEEEKRARVRRELEKVAKEQAERRATAKLMFDLGQKAYEKGMYPRAIEFLEASLTIISRTSILGGEIQIWLAMAYDANDRHGDCIALYRKLEKEHPMISIRRQAAELRYILEAPKLKISREEMVTIPLIGSSYDWYAGTWTDKNKDGDNKRKYTTTNQLPSSRDFLGDFLVWRPPIGWEKNPNVWAVVTLWFVLIGTALYLQS